ncbi:hypothetical protein LTR17_004492 [Elasticomyces elasticus]|nr:hypothetical protein LTR17_004492 [Elasticomyces elasticus]
MAPSISIREHIRWLPDPASEPTSTLVLTSNENRFIDIRVLKSNTESVFVASEGGVLPLHRLDWAFGGTSKSEARRSDEGKAYAHSTWMHWVSSRTRNVDGISDEGDMWPQPKGRVLETGNMINPATGKATDYEELWYDPPAKAVGDGDEAKKCCVVLQLHDDEHEARGLVVRVGQYVQGVLRIGKAFSLERWEWKGKGEGWKREVRMGDFWMPCGPATSDERLKMGGEVKFVEFVWKVVELSYF